MIRCGISIRKIHVTTQIHERTVQAIVNGHKRATGGYAQKIADAIGIPVEWLRDTRDYILPEPKLAPATKVPA